MMRQFNDAVLIQKAMRLVSPADKYAVYDAISRLQIGQVLKLSSDPAEVDFANLTHAWARAVLHEYVETQNIRQAIGNAGPAPVMDHDFAIGEEADRG